MINDPQHYVSHTLRVRSLNTMPCTYNTLDLITCTESQGNNNRIKICFRRIILYFGLILIIWIFRFVMIPIIEKNEKNVCQNQ